MTITATILIVHAIAFALLVALAWWVMTHPEIVARGQDAAGKGMLTGCLGILIFAVAGAIGLSAAIITAVQWDSIAVLSRVAGLSPITLVVGTLLVGYLGMQVSRRRELDRRHREAMAIPAALIVDDDDAVESALYNAISPCFPGFEITLRSPGALYWQQQEWYPRLRLLMLGSDSLKISQGDLGEVIQEWVQSLCRRSEAFPVLLHARDITLAGDLAARLRAAGWTVEVIAAEGDDWVRTKWLPIAQQILQEQIRHRETPAPA